MDAKQMANIPLNADEIISAIADEIADTVIYADLLAARRGIDLGNAVITKFNTVSKRANSDITI